MSKTTNPQAAKSELKAQSKTDLSEVLCNSAPNQEACKAFVERLQEANDNIDLRP